MSVLSPLGGTGSECERVHLILWPYLTFPCVFTLVESGLRQAAAKTIGTRNSSNPSRYRSFRERQSRHTEPDDSLYKRIHNADCIVRHLRGKDKLRRRNLLTSP